MSDDKKIPDASDPLEQEEKLVQQFMRKEMINKLKEKIDQNDPIIVRTIKMMIDDGEEEKESPFQKPRKD